MVKIDSFKFINDCALIEVSIIVPNHQLGLYLDEITIGTNNAYDIDTGDFKFDDDGITPLAPLVQYYNETDYKYGWVFKAPDSYDVSTEGSRYKSFSVTLNLDLNNMKDSDLFFIKIKTVENGTVYTDCCSTGDTWGSLYDSFGVDAKGMEYMKELADNCKTPEGMIDYILNKNAIDVAAGCGDYTTMISRYNELMGYSNVTTIGSMGNNYNKCGCNG